MKTLLRLAMIITMMVMGTTTVFAQSEYRRTIDKHCPVLVKAIDIDHSYSSVTITEWDKQEILMRAEIITKGKTDEIAKQMNDQIDVKFLPNLKDGTKIKTEINHDKINKLSKGSTEYQINISIQVPRSLAAIIKMGFGGTTINVPLKTLTYDGSYGNLKVAKVDQTAHVNMKFGNIDIDKVGGSLQGSTKYGNFSIKECPTLSINTEFGNAKIGKVEILHGYVNYGAINVTSARDIHMSGVKFSHCTIDNFQNILNVASLSYGSLNASTNEDFTDISIQSEFSPVKIAIGGAPSYSCDLKTQFGNITSAFPVTSTVTSTKKSNDYKKSIVGTVGNGGNKSIKITNSYSNIAIVKK